ncbi:HTH-type transcriptional regulator MalT [compost metagenome]
MQGLGSTASLVRRQGSYIPALPAAHLPRARLVDLLLRKSQRLRLLCAPAGFGKSVLLSECLRQLEPSQRVIWLSLEGQPLDLPQLVARLSAELGVGRLADARGLLDFFRSASEPLWLVLDDFPAEVPGELNAWIDQLLALPQSRLQVLVSGRQRPAWNLPRLLLEGELFELDADELGFTRDEFELFVSLLLPQASMSMREDLWQQTLGWCAGLRLLLTGLARQHGGAGSATPWLQDYLEHELLSRLSEDERSMLCGLAHLPKVSTELCAQLWEEQNGGRMFKRLLQCQSFFLPVGGDGIWYRMLPAVARALQGRLAAGELSRLRLRSCGILSAAGHFNEAIEQALCAEQVDVAANYMERLTLDWLYTEQHLRKLLDWREQLPDQLLESTPRLICLCARALLTSWRLEEADVCLARLGNFLPQPDAQRNRRQIANWQALHGFLQAARGDARAAQRSCEEALQVLPASDWRTSLLCYSSLARLAMVDGRQEQAQQWLDDGVEIARRNGCLASEALFNMDRIRLLLLRGDLTLAEALLEETLLLLERTGTLHSLIVGRLQLLQGELYLLRGGLDECEQTICQAMQAADAVRDPFVLHGHLLLSEVASCRGQYEQALLQLREAERQMHCGKISSQCYKLTLDLQLMRIHARQGDWAAVLPLGRSIEAHFGALPGRVPPLDTPSLPQRVQLLMALAEYETGQRDEAEQRLSEVLECCTRRRFGVLSSEAQWALARIAREQQRANADELERKARQQATKIGLYSLLLGWAEVRADVRPSPVVVASPLVRLPDSERSDLTQRELAVLRLLAEGLSNQEIGASLFISVNTVKTHTKKINAKLGVKRRTQAIMRAKAMGILA